MSASVVCLALFLLAATASGQGAREPVPISDRSVETAQWLTVAGTLAPVGLIFGGAVAGGDPGWDLAATGVLLLIPGPSLGYYYGGRAARGLGSTALRAAGLFGMLMGICWDSCGAHQAVFAAGGLVVFIGSAFHDMTHVGEDLRRDAAGEAGTEVVPILDPVGQRAGLAVRVHLTRHRSP